MQLAAADRLPALFRSPLCSRTGGARPSAVVTGYSPVVVRTARRLATSAIETNCEHNCSIDRAPPTAPESPPSQLLMAGGRAPFGAQPAEMSRARGSRG